MEPRDLEDVWESAARLQRLVPDTVLVGGSAAAYHARHRTSYDHDHVLSDLHDRFDLVLDALEREGDWVTNRVVPGRLVLGALGGIEAGVRQLIRRRPLQVEEVTLASGSSLRVPTAAETLRVKAFLVVKRNQMRDYLDVAALTDHLGTARSAGVLSEIDAYYEDPSDPSDRMAPRVATQVARQLAAPRPADARSIRQLPRYKKLQPRWQHWDDVVAQLRTVATAMLDVAPGGEGR